ncbi:MAG: hypothetical protein M1835_005254, partial [Candelina submexicana]
SAARRVAEENKKLRALLREKGVLDQEVDDFVIDGSNEKARNDGDALEDLLGTRKPCNGNSSCTRDSPEGSVMWEPAQIPNPQGLPKIQPLQVHPVGFETIDAVNIAPASTLEHPVPSHGLDGLPVARDPRYPPLQNIPQNYSLTGELGADQNTSSCAFAADIITAMANGVSTEDVHKQLGCNSATDCNVNNALLFNMMDRYSG